MEEQGSYGADSVMWRLTTPFNGTLVHTTFELMDSSPSDELRAVQVNVHGPTLRFDRVRLVLVEAVEAVTVAFALFAVKTVLLPGTA